MCCVTSASPMLHSCTDLAPHCAQCYFALCERLSNKSRRFVTVMLLRLGWMKHDDCLANVTFAAFDGSG